MNITIFCGGPSLEHEISLRSSQTILSALLQQKKHTATVLYITRDFRAAVFQPKTEILEFEHIDEDCWFNSVEASLEVIQNQTDLALLAGISGTFAEDGTLQKLLEHYHIPYTGSSSSSSDLCMNKDKASRAIVHLPGLSFPKSILISAEDPFSLSQLSFSVPIIVKPNEEGSSVDIFMCNNPAEVEIAVEKLRQVRPKEHILIQEYISGGIEISCGCLQDKNGNFIELPPIEIFPLKGTFFDYDSKYEADGATEVVPPQSLNKTISDKISTLTCTIHSTLGCSTYSRSDFIILEDDIYYLETNTLPGFTRTSLFPKETAAIGMSLTETLDFIIDNSL